MTDTYVSNAYYAAKVVSQAIRDGDLERLPRSGHPTIKCVDCGKPASCWDHRNYLRPLNVEAVCYACNRNRGKAENHNGYRSPATIITPAKPAVNFQELILTIRASHPTHTLEWIAAQVGVGYTTISMLKNTPGRQPRHALGERLIQLERECRK